MTKLHEILAAEKSTKSRVQRDLTALHRTAERAAGYSGMTRTYVPSYAEGETLPPETQRVQIQADAVLRDLQGLLSDLFNVTASKDFTNQHARADISINDFVLMADVPVTYLLFLEKQLNDVDTFIRKLPTLEPSVEWTWSDERGCYVSAEALVNRTQKVPTPIQLAPATDKHPAQVQMEYSDRAVGVYHTIRFSNALSVKAHSAMLTRVATLKLAVKAARQRANGVTVVDVPETSLLLDYIINGR